MHSARFQLIVLLLLSLVAAGFAQPFPSGGDIVVLVSIRGITLTEMAQSLTCRALMARGSMALLANLTGGSTPYYSTCMSISAGKAAKGLAAGNGSDTEPVDAKLNGWQPGIEVPAMEALRRLNAGRRTGAMPGLLGQLLEQHGVLTAAYGNADRGERLDRSTALIAVNQEGHAAGELEQGILQPAPNRPFGVRSNYGAILGKIVSHPGKAFIVVESGDNARLEEDRFSIPPADYRELRRQALEECGVFLYLLDQSLRGRRYRIYLAGLAPVTHDATRAGKLAPMLVLGSEIRPGLLSSASTRRAGLALTTDLTADVLQFFHVQAEAPLAGNPLIITPAANALPGLQAMDRQISEECAARPVLYGYLVFTALAMFLSCCTAFIPKARRWLRRIPLGPCLTAGMLGPVAMLAAAGLGIHATLPSAIFLLIVLPLAALIIHRRARDPRLILAIVGGVTALGYSLDILAGTPLLRQSLFSYDPIGGGRYYGLGNESTAVLIAAAVLAVFAWLEYRKPRRPFLLPGVAGFALAVLIGHPALGADFGGFLPVLVGFGVAIGKAYGRVSRRLLLGILAAGILLCVMVLAVNISLIPDHQTHVGQMLAQARHGGVLVIWRLFWDRLLANLEIMAHYWWALLLGALLVGAALLFLRAATVVRGLLRPYSFLSAGLFGSLMAILLAFLLNDTGIAMFGVGAMYIILPVLLLGQQKSTTNPIRPEDSPADSYGTIMTMERGRPQSAR